MRPETAPPDVDRLLRAGPPTSYNEAERHFSVILRTKLDELLQGSRDELLLMRKYAAEPNRLGVMSTPPRLNRSDLRLPIVEQLIRDAIRFLSLDSAGGPAAQHVDGRGRVVEVQDFPTRYPHIVLERVSVYDSQTDGATGLVEQSWRARRVQNQRRQTLVNRMFDAANLGLGLASIFR